MVRYSGASRAEVVGRGRPTSHRPHRNRRGPPAWRNAMLSPRWRKVVQDLVANKTRTALVVLSIAIGVFAVGMIAGTDVILSRDLDSNYMQANPSAAIIYTDDF